MTGPPTTTTATRRSSVTRGAGRATIWCAYCWSSRRRRGGSDRLSFRERGARLVDEVPFGGAIARLLGLAQRAPCLQQELVGFRPRAAQRALRLVADPVSLAPRFDRGLRRVGGGYARLLERAAKLGPLSLRLEQGALERTMKLGEVGIGAAEDAPIQPEPLRDRECVGCAG